MHYLGAESAGGAFCVFFIYGSAGFEGVQRALFIALGGGQKLFAGEPLTHELLSIAIDGTLSNFRESCIIKLAAGKSFSFYREEMLYEYRLH